VPNPDPEKVPVAAMDECGAAGMAAELALRRILTVY
jgi:hypothetical protein